MDKKLFLLLMGCRPEGRFTEQHDVFLGIASDITELVPSIKAAWPEAKGNIHLDAWRAVTNVDGYSITVQEKSSLDLESMNERPQLFFINLGGYKPNEFDEFHYKMLVVAPEKGTAVQQAKETSFYKHTGFKGAASHIDDKYGIDVDDVFEINELLSAADKANYVLNIRPEAGLPEDEIHLGYMQLHRLHMPSE